MKEDLDLGKIDDIEYLKDTLILATGIPRQYLDSNYAAYLNYVKEILHGVIF
jgi:hypothetical protein